MSRDASSLKPYFPVITVTVGQHGPQSLHPRIGQEGAPIWEPGDVNVRAWEIDSIGWSNGGAQNLRTETDLKGNVYVSGARVVVTSKHVVGGSHFTAYGIGAQQVLAAAGSKVSQILAQRHAVSQARVAQMRLPWISQIIYADPAGPRRSRGHIRLVGHHVTVFGDYESVLLAFHLRLPSETFSVIDALLACVVADRYHWETTTDAHRRALDDLPAPESVTATAGNLPSIELPGSYLIGAATGVQGTVSSRSIPAAQQEPTI